MAGPVAITVSVIRRRSWERQAKLGYYWNGSNDNDSKEGTVASDSTSVDYTTLLSGEYVECWPKNTKGGRGLGLRSTSVRHRPYGGHYLGRGKGPRGRGDRGFSDDFFRWSTGSVGLKLRDGVFTVGIRLFDRLGNRDAGPGVEQRILVKTTPRPAQDLQFTSYTAGVLSIKWRASLDIANT